MQQSDFGIIITKPISVWSKDLKISPKSFVRNLVKATINGFKGDFDDCAESLLDSLVDIKTEEKIGQVAWVLIYQAIQHSFFDLMQECFDLLNFTSQTHIEIIEQKLNRDINELFEKDLIITSEFLSQPEKLQIIELFSNLIESLCIEFGATEINSQAIASKLPNKFGVHLYRIWMNSPEKIQPLVDFLGSTFSKKNNELLKWKIYHQSLHANLDKRLFKEPFGLEAVYIKPRAFYKAPEKNNLDKRNKKAKLINHIVDVHNHLEEWILKQNTVDNLRFISGGPGSGKSSFSKVFASEIAKNTGYNVILIKLHYLDMSKDIDAAIQGYCNEYPSLRGIDISTTNKLIVVFDGLDEISMQGTAGESISKTFIHNLKIKSGLCSNVNRDIKFIVTGRDLAIQSCENVIKDIKCYLALLAYYIPNKNNMFPPEESSDPYKLLNIDQRLLWWKKFSKQKGFDSESMPESILTEELEPINSQPLLGYLLALSYLRGSVNFSKKPNLNTIYQDLLESVFDRQYASDSGDSNQVHNSIDMLSKADFDILMQEVALAIWHCNGTTATENYIYHHLKENELDQLLESITIESEKGVSNLLLSFYFRKKGQTDKGESTFEFTHKSFGEYLTSKKLVNLIIELTEAHSERKISYRKGKKFEDIISEWIKATGISSFNQYFYSFIEDEFKNLNLPQQKLEEVLELIQKMLNHSIRYNFSLENIPKLTYTKMLTYTKNANLALVAFHSACCNVLHAPEDKLFIINDYERRDEDINAWLYVNSYREVLSEYLHHMDFSAVSLFRDTFTCSNFSYSTFSNCDMFDVLFCDSYLFCINMSSSELSMCNFENSMLEEADFDVSTISKSIFKSSYLESSSFIDVDCSASDFSLANFSMAKLNRAEFVDCNFTGTNFEKADLTNAIFINCNFDKASFKSATLQGCNFREVDLTGADFNDADLSGCLLPRGTDKLASLISLS